MYLLGGRKEKNKKKSYPGCGNKQVRDLSQSSPVCKNGLVYFNYRL